MGTQADGTRAEDGRSAQADGTRAEVGMMKGTRAGRRMDGSQARTMTASTRAGMEMKGIFGHG
jgi:hypothetical protein